MKKFFLILIIFLFLICPCFAVEWVDLKNSKGAVISLDLDSVKEYNGYYFFNVNPKTTKSSNLVITMQCTKTHPFCARIDFTNYVNYINSNGNYDSMTNHMTKRLEPVTFESLAYVSYKKVSELLGNKNVEIVF